MVLTNTFLLLSLALFGFAAVQSLTIASAPTVSVPAAPAAPSAPSAVQSKPLSVTELCALVPGATILRPNTCANWVKCPTNPNGLDLEEGSCVFGLYFNKDIGQCQYKDEMVCPFAGEVNTPKNRCAHIPDGKFFSDEGDCHNYVYCKGGQEMKAACPNSLVYDPKASACVYEYQYKCPAAKPKNKSNPTCLSLPDDTFFADQSDCTKYSHCKNGSLTTFACDEDKAWDHLKGICVNITEVSCFSKAKKPEPENLVCGFKDNVKVGPVSDGASCSGYYFCKKQKDGSRDRRPDHHICEPGTFFDNNTLSCRDRLNVQCALDRCEGMGNKYVNVAGDCKTYALCKNGVSASRGRCPDNYFFDERTQGCTPSVVSYAACSV